MSTNLPAPALPPVHARTTMAIRWLSALTITLSSLFLLGAGWLAITTWTWIQQPHDDEGLAGVGYIFAAFLTAPTVPALLLLAVGWWNRQRNPGLALVLLSLATAGMLLASVLVLSFFQV